MAKAFHIAFAIAVLFGVRVSGVQVLPIGSLETVERAKAFANKDAAELYDCDEIDTTETAELPVGAVCKDSDSQCEEGSLCSAATSVCVPPPLTVVGGLWDTSKGIVGGSADKKRDTYVVPLGSPLFTDLSKLKKVDYGGLEEEKRAWVKKLVVWSSPGSFGYRFVKAPEGKVIVRIGAEEHWRNKAGGRLFSIVINGQVVEKDLDVFAEAGGKAKVLLKKYDVTVPKTGGLEIFFKRGSRKQDNPMADFIEVTLPADAKCTNAGIPCGSGLVCSATEGVCVPPSTTEEEEATDLPLGEACKPSSSQCKEGLLCSSATNVCVPPPLTVVGGLWDTSKGIVGGFADKKRDTYVVPIGSPIFSDTSKFKILDYGGLDEKRRAWVKSNVVWSRPGSFGYRFVKAPKGRVVVRLATAEHSHATVGARLFSIVINGKVVERNLDVFAEAGGRFKVLQKTYYVTVPKTGGLEIEFKRGSRQQDDPMVDFIEVSLPADASCTTGSIPCASGLICSATARACVPPPLTVVGGIWDEYQGIVAGSLDKTKDTSVVPFGKTILHDTSKQKIADYGVLASDRWTWVTSKLIWSRQNFGYRFRKAPKGKILVRLGIVEPYFQKAGHRRFNIAINGKEVERNLDVVAEAGGRFKVLLRTYVVNVAEKGDLTVEFKRGDRASDDPMVNFIEASLPAGASCTAGGMSCGSGLICSSTAGVCVRPLLTVVGGLWDTSKGIVAGYADKTKDTSIVPIGKPIFSDTSKFTTVNYGGLEKEKRGWVKSKVIWSRPGSFGYHFTNAPQGKLVVRLGIAEHWHATVNGRVFSIVINGEEVEKNLDVFSATGGKNKVLLKTYDVEVYERGGLKVEFKRGPREQDDPMVDFIEVSLPLGERCTAGALPCGAGLKCSATAGVCVPPPLTIVGGLWDESKGIVAGFADKKKDTTIVPYGNTAHLGSSFHKIVDYRGLEKEKWPWVNNKFIWSRKNFGFRFTKAPTGKVVVRVGIVERWHKSAGGRRFSIAINGKVVESNLDVVRQAGGRFKVWLKSYYVTVPSSGGLVIEFRRGARAQDDPMVDFIEVKKS